MNIEASTRVLLDKMNAIQNGDLQAMKKPEESQAFGGIFGQAVQQFEASQLSAEEAVQSLVKGEDVQLHDVMIQTTEAQLSLELAVQVRNKCLEAYNDLKNMQF
ncbi:flagellar hook-basal body complex protein FliE [Jeotgalibaca caeni]|uniref:flagellar hook-basal body complex protein FliE n=1 Tax=Jeotgalibaca caeni TaxID=3028623 RepID=UPI00237EBB8B|nr:flagellar hook-basal body complex protein FliE [Jeotgalibaca caeni]MDE1548286.1 flagellar hook-basal body complex protein FliE [Jeotgalibaca caeni]